MKLKLKTNQNKKTQNKTQKQTRNEQTKVEMDTKGQGDTLTRAKTQFQGSDECQDA